MRPARWNLITQIVIKYARDTLIPTNLLTNGRFGPPRTFIRRAHKIALKQKYK